MYSRDLNVLLSSKASDSTISLHGDNLELEDLFEYVNNDNVNGLFSSQLDQPSDTIYDNESDVLFNDLTDRDFINITSENDLSTPAAIPVSRTDKNVLSTSFSPTQIDQAFLSNTHSVPKESESFTMSSLSTNSSSGAGTVEAMCINKTSPSSYILCGSQIMNGNQHSGSRSFTDRNPGQFINTYGQTDNNIPIILKSAKQEISGDRHSTGPYVIYNSASKGAGHQDKLYNSLPKLEILNKDTDSSHSDTPEALLTAPSQRNKICVLRADKTSPNEAVIFNWGQNVQQEVLPSTVHTILPSNAAIVSMIPSDSSHRVSGKHSVIRVTRPPASNVPVVNQLPGAISLNQTMNTTSQYQKAVLNKIDNIIVRATPSIDTIVVPTTGSTVPAQPKVAIDRITTSTTHSIKQGSKKSGHSDIERRYRNKLAKATRDLKEIVPASDQKVYKWQVYSGAVDHIKHQNTKIHQLEKEVKKLREENAQLKKEKKANYFNVLKNLQKNAISLVPDTIEEDMDMSQFASTSPTYLSSVTDSDTSPVCSPSFEEMNIDMDLPSNIDFSSMLDKTRVVLMVVFCVLMFNPAQWLFGPGGSLNMNQQFTGRTLQGMNDAEPVVSPYIGFFSWVLTGFLALFILIKLLVSGEPYLQRKSSAWEMYRKCRKQAESSLNQGDTQSTIHHLNLCLSALGRPLPTSSVELISSLLWQIFHHFMHRIGLKTTLGRLCTKLPAGNQMAYILRMKSARKAAVCYHTLHELYLTGQYPVSQLQAVNMCLASINMVDSANNSISSNETARIYLTAAIHLRTKLPSFLQVVCRYFLSMARHVINDHKDEVTTSLHWITDKVGHTFFIHGEWNLQKKPKIFTSPETYMSPVCELSQRFYNHLARRSLEALLASDPRVTLKTVKNKVYSATLMSDGGFIGHPLSHTLEEKKDPVCEWWSAMIQAAFSSLYDPNNDRPDKSHVHDLPIQLESRLDVKAFYIAYQAQKLFASQTRNYVEAKKCIELCHHASSLLQTLRATSESRKSTDQQRDPTSLMIQILALHWILQTRFNLWLYKKHSGSSQFLVGSIGWDVAFFQRDLDCLRCLTHDYKSAYIHIPVYEAMLRIIAGANPISVQQLLIPLMNSRMCTTPDINIEDSHATDRLHVTALKLTNDYASLLKVETTSAAVSRRTPANMHTTCGISPQLPQILATSS